MFDVNAAGGGGPVDADLLEETYLAALDLEPGERGEFLSAACAGHAGLRREVDELLALAEEQPGLLVPPEIGLIPDRIGHYEILGESGRGGMGIVLKAQDTRLLRVVALKVLPRYLSRDERSRKRFTREARILAGLKHPNIATLYSLEQHGELDFLTMEFVEGTTLAEIMAHRRLSQDEVTSLAWQLVAALEAAHAQGVCHCDLTPANVMLAPDGKVSVLDFGIARARGQVVHIAGSQAGGAAAGITVAGGTPGYMAPEQAAGGEIDQRSDLWSLGVILYECLSGRRFEPRSAGWETGADWAELPATAPRPLAELVDRCLVPDPQRRLASAKVARKLIQSLIERRESRARRWWSAAAALACAAAVAWVVVGGGPDGPPRELRIVDGYTVTAVGEDQAELWSRRLEDSICGAQIVTRTAAGTGRAAVDQVVGGALALRSADMTSSLLLLDPTGRNEIWQHDPRWTLPVNARGPFLYRWLAGIVGGDRAETVLLAAVRDGAWYAMGVEAVAADGSLSGVYHHPGPLRILRSSLEVTGDRSGIIMYGTNSSARFDRRLVPFATEHHPGCLVRLDPDQVEGQAYPYSEDLPEHRDWPGLPQARERAYLLIPLLHPSHGARVDQFQWHDLQTGGGCDISTEDGRFVILDEDFRPQQAVITLHSFADSLFQAGAAHNPPYLYIKDGLQHWIDVPLSY